MCKDLLYQTPLEEIIIIFYIDDKITGILNMFKHVQIMIREQKIVK